MNNHDSEPSSTQGDYNTPYLPPTDDTLNLCKLGRDDMVQVPPTNHLTALANTLKSWIEEPQHYNIVHFATECSMSKEELFRLGGESAELQSAIDYAFSMQEWKVVQGMQSGDIHHTIGLRMLETYNGWKGEVNVLQRNEYKSYMSEARSRAESILSSNQPTDALKDPSHPDFEQSPPPDEPFSSIPTD